MSLALARRVGGTFLSTDHHELDALKAAGVCEVEFIRYSGPPSVIQ